MAFKVEIIYHRRRSSYVISTTAADVLAMQGANSINSHDINRFFPECSGFSTSRVHIEWENKWLDTRFEAARFMIISFRSLWIWAGVSAEFLLKWPVACSVPSYYLNQCWNIVNWTLGNNLHWNFNLNSCINIQQTAFESVVSKMAASLSRPQCVDVCRKGRYSHRL